MQEGGFWLEMGGSGEFLLVWLHGSSLDLRSGDDSCKVLGYLL